jgi:beta-lactamase class A
MLPALAALAVTASVPPSLQERVAAELRGVKATFGVAATRLGTGETVTVNPDMPFPTASTIKVGVMVEAFHRIAEGTLRHDTPFTLKEAEKVGGSGVLQGLHDGIVLTTDDLLHLMIAVSDNTATNLLVARLGTARIDERLASHGLARTRIFRPTFRDGRADVHPELEREFGLGMATPREMTRLMELLATGRVVDRQASEAMVALLARQAFPSPVPRLLPDQDGVTVANKPGWDAEKQPGATGVRGHVRADAGIVRTPRGTYVLSLFARQIEDTRWGPDNEAATALARVARVIHEHFDR